MWKWLILLSYPLIAGCASAPPPPTQVPEDLFQDQRFSAPSQRISADEVFALNDDMTRYVRVDIAPQLRHLGRQRGLIAALRSRGQLQLDYDSEMTRNASEAFESRTGNCLSLVIMTAALAKALDLPVTYQSVIVDEAWSRSGSIYFASGHVNLVIGKRIVDKTAGYDPHESLTIDFLPPEDIVARHTLVIDEATIVAMYFNNRAAEALARDDLNDAYAWASAAIRHKPGFLSAYNTLGVIYREHRDEAQAEHVLRYALQLEPRNAHVLANLAELLEDTGRGTEAQPLRERLARLESAPPFHYFNLGMAAMREGNYAAARALFAREVERSPDYHEFHFWLAIADYKLGDIEAARKHLTLAMEDSTTRRDHDIYAAKLAWIKSYRTQPQ